MNDKYFYADLHGHLGMWKYKGSFDKVIDIALKRLGTGGALGVDSDPVCNDFRYEDFISKSSEKYIKEDIDGRATRVIDRGDSSNLIYIINGHEVETRIGHFLVSASESYTSFHKGKEADWEKMIEIANKQNSPVFIVHSFSLWGAGKFFEEKEHHLNLFQGIEAANANCYFPLPGYPRPNNRSAEFFKRVYPFHSNLGGVVFQDNHKLYEIGRNATRMLGSLDPNNFIQSLSAGIRSCTPDRLEEHKYSPFWGFIGGTHHLFDNIVYEGISLFKKIKGN
ncbi:MAG: hypothetical protein Q7S27_06860 [Nanoarchaeota archaeon]|nr:hypothetical protein [Nanoarchaeota archaeon]